MKTDRTRIISKENLHNATTNIDHAASEVDAFNSRSVVLDRCVFVRCEAVIANLQVQLQQQQNRNF